MSLRTRARSWANLPEPSAPLRASLPYPTRPRGLTRAGTFPPARLPSFLPAHGGTPPSARLPCPRGHSQGTSPTRAAEAGASSTASPLITGSPVSNHWTAYAVGLPGQPSASRGGEFPPLAVALRRTTRSLPDKPATPLTSSGLARGTGWTILAGQTGPEPGMSPWPATPLAVLHVVARPDR